MVKSQYTKKQIEEGCDELVQKGLLVKINPDSKEPSWQETEAFLEKVWGLTKTYQKCEKCNDYINLDQEEFIRMNVDRYWVYLHAQCTLPHIGFFAIRKYYEDKKGVPNQPIRPKHHKWTKAEKDLIIRYFKKNFGADKRDD